MCFEFGKSVWIAISLTQLAILPIALGEESTANKIERGVNDAVTSVKATTYDALDKTDLVVTFARGSSEISSSQKRNLEAFARSLDLGKLPRKLVVAGWSDHSYPMEKATRLSTPDEKLGARRASEVASFLKSQRTFARIETFNMAKRATAFERIFGSDDAKIQEELATMHGKDFELHYVASVLKEKGAISTAVVVVYNRDIALSH